MIRLMAIIAMLALTACSATAFENQQYVSKAEAGAAFGAAESLYVFDQRSKC